MVLMMSCIYYATDSPTSQYRNTYIHLYSEWSQIILIYLE
jgi:hypothetical protein